MTAAKQRITLVNHVAVDIAASVDAVWDYIVSQYCRAQKFEKLGNVRFTEDLAAPLGSYIVSITRDDGTLDERVARITEFDASARRLSICADYVSWPSGVVVYATYQVLEEVKGARFCLDCHTVMTVDVETGCRRDEIAGIISEMTLASEADLLSYLQSVRQAIEALSQQ